MLNILSAVTSPVLLGGLLVGLTFGPAPIKEALNNQFPGQLALPRTILQGLLVLHLIGYANRALNRYALGQRQLQAVYASASDTAAGKGIWKWNEEVAAVTGGSNGIGSLLAKRLATKGVKVAVIDIVPLPEDMEGLPNISFYKCDITDPAAVTRTASAIRSALGPPSILVNNAGIVNDYLILSTPPAALRKIFDVNLLSHYYTLQAFVPDMQARGKGHVMATASMASYVVVRHMVDYGATKAGVLALYEGLRAELRAEHECPGVCVSTVHPSYVRTGLIGPIEDLLVRARQNLLEPEYVADRMAKQIFSGQSGQIFLPDWASLVTGLRGWPHWAQELLRGLHPSIAKRYR